MALDPRYAPLPVTTSTQLDCRNDGGIYSSRFNDFYYSPGQGAEESLHVFIEGNQLNQRWKHFENSGETSVDEPKPHFLIGETGFGTGLNFLTALDCWLKSPLYATGKTELLYSAIEKHPLTRAAMQKVLLHYNPFPELSEALFTRYPDPISGNYLLDFSDSGYRCKLILNFESVSVALDQFESYPQLESINDDSHKFDAWFLDGFSPKENAEMWHEQSMKKIAALSDSNTTLATFTVAGPVKASLRQAGFAIEKRRGFGKKREMLTASFKPAEALAQRRQATDKNPTEKPPSKPPKSRDHSACYYRFSKNASSNRKPRRVAIIGAGIAGCTTAYQLAQLGVNVTVIEQAANVGFGASGNEVAVVHPRTFKQRSLHADFYESALHYASQFYANPKISGFDNSRSERGVYQIDADFSNVETLCDGEYDFRAGFQCNNSASARDGIFYSNAGWIEPRRLCDSLLRNERISVKTNSKVTRIDKPQSASLSEWTLEINNGDKFSFDDVVLACASTCNRLSPLAQMPISDIRGQTTTLTIPDLDTDLSLTTAYCEEGYLVLQQKHWALKAHYGASYSKSNQQTKATKLDCLANIDALCDIASISTDLYQALTSVTAKIRQAIIEADEIDGPLHTAGITIDNRVGFRATTPDYLPIVGLLPETPAYKSLYRELAFDASKSPSQIAPMQDGLYIIAGLGSHGFLTTPLLSQMLASQILQQPSLVAESLRRAVSPQRFLLRDIIRSGGSL